MLEWLELHLLAEKFPAALSRDMQARAGLARALMLRPELLFLDNPLARLEARSAAGGAIFSRR
jgi:phospholipid/cholesterol/gamma-HCH transport system ATP-binding protein